jgi:hypothetical protein
MPAIANKLEKWLRWDRLPQNVIWFIQLVILVLFAWAAIISIVEVNARNSFSSALVQRRDRIVSKMSFTSQDSTPATQTGDVKRTPPAEALAAIELTEEKLLHLSLYGTSNDALLLESLLSTDVASMDTDSTSSGLRNFIGGRIAYFSSNLITAILIVCCGAIGAVVAGFRDERPATFRHLCLGVSSGFIVFLSIRGGQEVFLFQVSKEFMPVNPFSSGLVGLLSGLFSERFYALIRKMTDSVSDRLEKAIDGEDAPRPKNADNTQ